LRLATRFLKAKLNAFVTAVLKLHGDGHRDIMEKDIDQFLQQTLAQDAGTHHELKEMYGIWTGQQKACSEHTAEECDATVVEARRRLRALPIYKSMLCPVFEYYRVRGVLDVRFQSIDAL